MRVGIMSMQRVENYGSFMQALALKRMIESLGHEVIFVDYRVEPAVALRHSLKEKYKCRLKLWKKDIKSSLVGKRIYRVLHKEKSAQRDTMLACNAMLGITEWYLYRQKVDILVIGSDEVFNCLQNGYTVGYSLELFGQNNRAKKVITYAASFGSTTLERLNKYKVGHEIAPLLSDMAALSVRDENSYNIIESLCDRKSEIHMDPVLVGGVEILPWREHNCEDYVILYGYSYRFSKEECAQIMEFAHKRGKSVIALGEDQLLRDQHIRCRPDEVLPYFKKASYVFTDTFHGTIFSVINHRSFMTVIRPGNEGNQQKLGFLMKQLGLEDRLIENFKDIEVEMQRPIDYDRVDALRDVQHKRTMEYLGRYIN